MILQVKTLPISFSLYLALLAFSCGCIHPNLPSVRYTDQQFPVLEEVGNQQLLPPELQNYGRTSEHPSSFQQTPNSFSGQSEASCCETDGYLTDSFCSHHQPKTPEAPWPRFHPLPTRPVLGPNQPIP